jgi:hypothetical protein
VLATAPSNLQYIGWNSGTSKWEPKTLAFDHTALTGVDTDIATTSIHHTIGAGATQAAAGNHSHGSAGVQSVTDTASIDLTLTGTALSAAAIFGTTATTVAVGNHTHAAFISAVNNTASITLTNTGGTLTAAAVFGSTGGTVAQGNHNHDTAYSLLSHNHNALYADISHTHGGNVTRDGHVTKTYSSTNITSAAGDVSIASKTVVLSSGVIYECFVLGMAQGGMNTGQPGNISVGVRQGGGATTWGMEVGTENGERPLMASEVYTMTGTGAAETFTLRAQVTSTGTGSIQAGHLTVIAIPRQTT